MAKKSDGGIQELDQDAVQQDRDALQAQVVKLQRELEERQRAGDLSAARERQLAERERELAEQEKSLREMMESLEDEGYERDLAADAAKRPFTVADLRRKMEEDPSEPDPARFIRKHNLPKPKRAFRVAATRRKLKGEDYDGPKAIAGVCWAVDESEAIRQVFDQHRIPQQARHRWQYKAYDETP